MGKGVALILVLQLALLGDKHLLDLSIQRTILLGIAHSFESSDSISHPTFGQVPTSRLRHEANTYPQRDGRD